MKYSKFLDGIYIVGIALNNRGILITRKEYKAIEAAFITMPEVEDSQIARLRDGDLTWDIIESNKGGK